MYKLALIVERRRRCCKVAARAMRFHWDLLEGGHPEKHRLAKIIFFDSEEDHAHTLFFLYEGGGFFSRG